MGTARFVGEQEEQLSWPDQAQFSPSYLLDRSGIHSQSVRRLSEFLVLEAEPAEVVGKNAVLLSGLQRVNQTVLADKRVGDEYGCTKNQGEVHDAAEPDGWLSHKRGTLTLEANLATRHEQSEMFGTGLRLGHTFHRAQLRGPQLFSAQGAEMNREQGAEVVVVWTTFPGDGDPATFSQTLVSERLAACVTTQAGLRSVYRWQDDVEVATEYQLIIKTTADRVRELERRVEELHPYQVPEFLILPVKGGSATYLAWVGGSTRVEPRSD